MKAAISMGCGVLLLACTMAVAGDLKSGLQVGDAVPAFNVEKVAGAPNDGKESGDTFCYRCMLGAKPVVMVFSRKSDESLSKLVKELDAACGKNADKKLSSFVNLIGKDADQLKSAAKKLGDKLQNVAVVVPTDTADGPKDFNIAADAETTVMIYREGKVEANHAIPSGKLDEKTIKAIVADTSKILK